MGELCRRDVPKGGSAIRCRLLQVGEEIRVDVRHFDAAGSPGSGFTLAPETLPALVAALREVERAAHRASHAHTPSPEMTV